MQDDDSEHHSELGPTQPSVTASEQLAAAAGGAADGSRSATSVVDQNDKRVEGSKQLGLRYYVLCAIGGLLSCGITHTLVTPLDLIKCRIQTNPLKYTSLFKGLSISYTEGGLRSLSTGYIPTFLGYSMQGVGKFGLYEFFKSFFAKCVGEEKAHRNRTELYLAASASAEFFADIFLCPMETLKVKMQTDPNYPSSFSKSFKLLTSKQGYSGLMRSNVLASLWGRQIPYTMMKFTCFERTNEAIYKHILRTTPDQTTRRNRLLATVASGYIAGVFCAVVSHPSDVLISVFNKPPPPVIQNALPMSPQQQVINPNTAGLVSTVRNIGFKGLWNGLGTRIIMIGALTSAQWFIYDSWKVIMSLPTQKV